uniref:Uncharacterized protein n=1 Tax=Arundo donax TaxID=35708 RepID=A0A0A9BMS0_ARUDO
MVTTKGQPPPTTPAPVGGQGRGWHGEELLMSITLLSMPKHNTSGGATMEPKGSWSPDQTVGRREEAEAKHGCAPLRVS